MKVLRTVIEKIIEELYDPANGFKATLEKYNVSSSDFGPSLEMLDMTQQYESMQQCRAEAMVEEVVEIADSDLDPMRARNRIDARKWYASKMKPNKFGEKIQLDVNTNVDLSNALIEARARKVITHDAVYQVIDSPKAKETGVIEDEAQKLLVAEMLK